MKATIKEIAKREGKKSQVAIGNLKEVLSVYQDMYQDILAEEMAGHIMEGYNTGDIKGSEVFSVEFNNSLCKKVNKFLKKINKSVTVGKISIETNVVVTELPDRLKDKK